MKKIMFDFDSKQEVREAFRSGNRSRKKESVQDTVESVDSLQTQIDRFKEQTGVELEIRDGRPYFNNYLYLNGCTELTSLPDGLTVRDSLDLSNCTGLTSLPDGLTVGGSLWLGSCTGLTSLPDGLVVNNSLVLRGCTGLTSLPDSLVVIYGSLELTGCTGLTSLPSRLTIRGFLDLSDCTGLPELPSGLTVGGNLWLGSCTELTSLPQGLTVKGSYIYKIPDSLRPFIERLGIEIDRDRNISAQDWMERRHLVSQMDEAFKAGNRSRKKESVQAAVESVDSVQIQIDRFKEQTGVELEIVNGRPCYSKVLEIFDNDRLTTLPDRLLVGWLNLKRCVNLKSIPSGVTVKGNLCLADCTGLKSIGPDLKVEGYLNLCNCTGLTSLPSNLSCHNIRLTGCTGLTSLPADLTVSDEYDYEIYGIPDSLRPFIEKLGIEIDRDGDISARDWMKKRHLIDQTNEAFKAGNRSRKKEAVQDAVESVDNVQKQIDLFKKQTGVQLEIRDGKPYINSLTDDDFKNPDTVTWLPDGLTLDYNLNLEDFKKLKSLPPGLTVTKKGIILCNCTGLISIAGNLSVKGCLDLWRCSSLKSISANLTVGEDLYLSYCTSLKSLPTNMTVGGALYLEGCTGLTTLPADLTVGDYIFQIPDSLIPFIKNLGIEIYKNTDGYWIEASDWMNKRHLVDQVTEAFRAGNRARKKESAQDSQSSNVDSIDDLDDLLDVCDKVAFIFSGKEYGFPKGWVFGINGSDYNSFEIVESTVNKQLYLRSWLVKYKYDFNGSRIRNDLDKEIPDDGRCKFDSEYDIIHSTGRATHLKFDYTVSVMKKTDNGESGYCIIFNDGVNEICIYMPEYSRSRFALSLMHLFSLSFMKAYIKAAYYQGVNDPFGDVNYKKVEQTIINLFTDPIAWNSDQVMYINILQDTVYMNPVYKNPDLHKK